MNVISGDWKRGFHRAMIDALVKNGTPVGDNPSFYGYIADNWPEISERVRTTGIDYETSTFKDSEWHEFKGTFYEGDTRTTGIDVNLVLLDGSIAKYRWEGHPGDLIQQVANS